MGDGRPEQGHEAVAQELIDGAFIAVHGAQGKLKELVQARVCMVSGPELLGQARVIRQVTEEHGDLLALPLQRRVGRQNFLDQVRRRVGTWLPYRLVAGDRVMVWRMRRDAAALSPDQARPRPSSSTTWG